MPNTFFLGGEKFCRGGFASLGYGPACNKLIPDMYHLRLFTQYNIPCQYVPKLKLIFCMKPSKNNKKSVKPLSTQTKTFTLFVDVIRNFKG